MGYGTEFPSQLDIDRARRRECATDTDANTKSQMGRVDWADENCRRTQSVNLKKPSDALNVSGKGHKKNSNKPLKT